MKKPHKDNAKRFVLKLTPGKQNRDMPPIYYTMTGGWTRDKAHAQTFRKCRAQHLARRVSVDKYACPVYRNRIPRAVLA